MRPVDVVTQVAPMADVPRPPIRQSNLAFPTAAQPLRRAPASLVTQALMESSPISEPGVLPPLAVIALNRMAFGPSPSDMAAFEALGANDDARFEAYVEQQLHPDGIDDSGTAARLVAAEFTTLNKTREQLWTDHHKGLPGGPTPNIQERSMPFWETERATYLRAIYSRRQLKEVLADFWHNHFNVFGFEYWQAPMWVHYDRDIIRAHQWGNFRQMLEAVATSFPMMLYLDGFDNTVSGPNENFARELFELHTLGAENYLGVIRQDDVPLDANRQPVGYVDDDVYESTRAFTGWGIDFDTGAFQYFSDRHDRFQKYSLGKFLRADQATMKDGRDVLDVVATHPGTARHIARKLCRRLIGDDPPASVVAAAAQVFQEQHESPDQLRLVVGTILRSHEFRTTWGQKIKRPFEFAVSCCRAVEAELPFGVFHPPSSYLITLVGQAGQPLFQWPSPDGYSDAREKWIGSNAYVGRWQIANFLNDLKNWSGTMKHLPFDPIAAMPSEVRSARDVADFWIQRILGRPMSVAAHEEVVEFMARGRDPATALPGFDDALLRERVWGTIALIMTSPDFLLR